MMLFLPILALATGVQTLPSDALPSDAPAEVAQAAGPLGTSGDAHEDGVGYAGVMAEPPQGRFAQVVIGVAHPTLPVGTPVELTALATGRTIVAMVVAREDGSVVALSPGAAQALGVGDHAGVRVRSVVASPQDQNALRNGQAASPRLDAPPALLVALRRKLPGDRAPLPPKQAPTKRAPPKAVVAKPAPARPAPAKPAPTTVVPAPDHAAPVAAATPKRSTPPAQVAQHGSFVVQVAALSAADRAATLARDLGGRVVPLGKLFRVQLGPFADMASAKRARDGAARRGYGDARILHTD